MTETEMDNQLKEFLSEEVPCEGDPAKGVHAADAYWSFKCEHCNADPLIGAQCNDCHRTITAIMQLTGSLPCLSCPARSSLEAYKYLGPIR